MATLIVAGLVMASIPTSAFDLQGHRGARGLAPENTIAGFATALAIGVTTLELDLAMTKDDVLVVSHDSHLNPDHTRGPNGAFLAAAGPAIRALTLAEVKQYDVGRLKPGTDYARRFPGQKPVDGARIPALTEVFDLVRRSGAEHMRFNIETKLTPTSADYTPDPQTFAEAFAAAVRGAGLASQVTVQSFDWRTLVAMKKIAPEIERVCLTIEALDDDNIQRGRPGPSPWTAGFDIDDVGSTPKLAAAAGCQVWSPFWRNVDAASLTEAKTLGLKVIPWTINERAQMEGLISLGVDGIITDYPDRLRALMIEKGMAVPPVVPTR
jgi:glycerophosphoryl diester phosphodiesterase